jgi:hypothetical protein
VAGVLTFVFVFVYPDHRPASRPAAVLTIVSFALAIIGASLIAVHPGPLFMWPRIDNPFGIGPTLVPDMAGDQALIPGFLAVAWTAAAIWVGWRYLRSRGVERLQMKWFVSAAIVSVLALVVTLLISAAGSGAGTDPLPGLAYAFTNTLVPVAVGIAILRYHLYAIDRLVNRAMVYTAVTVVLAAVYLVAVTVLGAIGRSVFAGASDYDTLVVAVSTLIVAGLFDPLRRRVQDAVDRRFDRARYDAAQTVDAFSRRLQETLELAAVEQATIEVIHRTLRPASAGIWLGKGP